MKEDKNTKLSRYELVNSCETLEELKEAILYFSDDFGDIQGRDRVFNARKMASFCEEVILKISPNVLTRMWGIRQQAIYIIQNN